MRETYLKLALNNAWSNATLHAAVRPLDQAAFSARRPGFFPSLAETLGHILEVDLYYLDALEEGGEGLSVFDRSPPRRAADLAEAQAEADNLLVSLCRNLTADRLDRVLSLERPAGLVRETASDLLLHLFQHQIHHRGQAHVQLQDAGIAPPQLDEFFLAHDRAPTARAYWL